MAQIQKKEKNVRPGLEKNILQKTFFTSVSTVAREIPKKIEGKNPDSNRKNDTKSLSIFTGNVKPYIQIHF